MSEKAIVVEQVSKSFKLPHEKHTGIKDAIINFRPGKKFEVQDVLKDVSFSINKGEFFGIVGRNGSGKSTLLKLLAQIYTPNKGGIQVNGSLTPFIELGVGFNPNLTGRENVFLNGALLGFNRKQVADMYDDIVNFAELERFMDQKLKNYSSGMQVRLAFSIAVRAQSDILLIDEVLAVGDSAFQRKCYDHFMLLKKQKKTVILVTHDMGAVRQYCDRAIMIEKGEIVAEGSPDVIAQKYQKLFLSEIEAEHKNVTDGTEDRWGTGKMRSIKSSTDAKEQEIVIKSEYEAYADLVNPIIGFTIFNSADQSIVDGNTLKLHKKLGTIKKGDKLKATWIIPNIFATGNYSVSTACCDESRTEFYDWLNGAGTFDIQREIITTSIVDPVVSLNLEHDNSE